jgi:hypothetical protein
MNCNASSSAGAARVPTERVARAALAIAATVGSALGGSLANASTAELDDAAARMQYAFFTADTRSLEDVLSLVQRFDAEAASKSMKSYQLAYGYWKLAELYAQDAEEGRSKRDSAGQASKAAEACSEHARAAVKDDPRFAEAYAIQAACEDMPHGFLRLAGLRPGSCARSRELRQALSQAPRNPRVMFIEALCTDDQDEGAQLARWRKVDEAFAEAEPARPGMPDWGHAEALTLLAEQYLQHRNFVAARDAVERALVIAPDYHVAQTLLETIASQR